MNVCRKSPHSAVCLLPVRAAPGPAALLHPGLRHGGVAPHHPVCGSHSLSALQLAVSSRPGPPQAQVRTPIVHFLRPEPSRTAAETHVDRDPCFIYALG